MRVQSGFERRYDRDVYVHMWKANQSRGTAGSFQGGSRKVEYLPLLEVEMQNSYRVANMIPPYDIN